MTTITRDGYRRLNPSLSDNTTAGRAKIGLEARCRICGVPPGGKVGRLTRHHLVPHAWFLERRQELKELRNANANIVPLCRACHAVVDHGRDVVGRLQARATLRTKLYPYEVAFILQIRGRDWFEHHYPRDP